MFPTWQLSKLEISTNQCSCLNQTHSHYKCLLWQQAEHHLTKWVINQYSESSDLFLFILWIQVVHMSIKIHVCCCMIVSEGGCEQLPQTPVQRLSSSQSTCCVFLFFFCLYDANLCRRLFFQESSAEYILKS